MAARSPTSPAPTPSARVLADELRARDITVDGLVPGPGAPGADHDTAELVAVLDRWRFGPWGRSLLDELLAAVDVERGAGDRDIRHQVHGERGDVGRSDDAPDRQGAAELLAAGVELVAEQ
jgi:hypothetical protein